MELNKDIETRDKIIFGRYRPAKYEHGGTNHFSGMNVKTLKKLLSQNFIDPMEQQNLAPPVCEIYEFMQKYPKYTCHGYAVSINRSDYRVSIEGVEKGTPAETPTEFQDFIGLFKNADVMNLNTNYCWYD